jgi:hypothetical protein
MTGKTQVVSLVATLVLLRNYVVHVQRDERQFVLVQVTILAAISRAVANETTECGVDSHANQRAVSAVRIARAFACRTPMKLMVRT